MTAQATRPPAGPRPSAPKPRSGFTEKHALAVRTAIVEHVDDARAAAKADHEALGRKVDRDLGDLRRGLDDVRRVVQPLDASEVARGLSRLEALPGALDRLGVAVGEVAARPAPAPDNATVEALRTEVAGLRRDVGAAVEKLDALVRLAGAVRTVTHRYDADGRLAGSVIRVST